MEPNYEEAVNAFDPGAFILEVADGAGFVVYFETAIVGGMSCGPTKEEAWKEAFERIIEELECPF